MTSSPQTVTAMLQQWRQGDRRALDQLLPLIYDELRRQAARCLRHEYPAHSLQPTALVHEAYLRLIDQPHVEWQNRAHFFAIAAKLMRQILVDHARSKQAAKRGGRTAKLPMEEAVISGSTGKEIDLVELDEALTRLEALDERKSRIVELRYFSGLTVEETAAVLEVSPATVKQEWRLARAWLRREIGGE